MYTYKIYKEKSLIIVKFSGHILKDEILSYFPSVINDPEYDQSYCGVADLRGATFDVTVDDVVELASIGSNNTVARWVILVDAPESTAFAFLYSDVANKRHPLKVASEPSTATEFLGIDVEPYL